MLRGHKTVEKPIIANAADGPAPRRSFFLFLPAARGSAPPPPHRVEANLHFAGNDAGRSATPRGSGPCVQPGRRLVGECRKDRAASSFSSSGPTFQEDREKKPRRGDEGRWDPPWCWISRGWSRPVVPCRLADDEAGLIAGPPAAQKPGACLPRHPCRNGRAKDLPGVEIHLSTDPRRAPVRSSFRTNRPEMVG